MRLYSLQQGEIDLSEPPLGAGGEGAVYRITSGQHRGCVAKIYHQPADARKRDKLAWMITQLDSQLDTVTAWPRDLIVDADSGAARGFVMAEITESEPLHHYYSPTWQRQNCPEVHWGVLLRVARNTASAFATLHDRGIVIGDVNPNLAKVCNTGIVKLIDCDSYQIHGNDIDYLCDVGVAGFTPPELQGVSSFADVKRTLNHDCFGLSLLIFHLLFMGRHPFSGVPIDTFELPLEQAIQEFRYAYSRSAAQRGIEAPPASIRPESLVPERGILAFEQAFTELGIQPGGRPSAREWVEILDGIAACTEPCPRNHRHHFVPLGSGCPWCGFLARHGLDFFPDRITYADLDLLLAQLIDPAPVEAVWQEILAIRKPVALTMPAPQEVAVTPQPLAAPLLRLRRLTLLLRVLLALVAIGTFLATGPSPLSLLLAAAAVLASRLSPRPLQEEHRRRRARRRATEGALIALRKQIQLSDPLTAYTQAREALQQEKARFPRIIDDYRREIDRMKELAIGPALQSHLERHLIADARIAMIDETRKTVLASFGIESAAELSTEKILAIRGFGKVHIDNLMKWRKTIEQSFHYDPHRVLREADVQPVQRNYLLQKAHLLEALRSGADSLRRIVEGADVQQIRFQEEFRRHELDAAAARADCTVI